MMGFVVMAIPMITLRLGRVLLIRAQIRERFFNLPQTVRSMTVTALISMVLLLVFQLTAD